MDETNNKNKKKKRKRRRNRKKKQNINNLNNSNNLIEKKYNKKIDNQINNSIEDKFNTQESSQKQKKHHLKLNAIQIICFISILITTTIFIIYKNINLTLNGNIKEKLEVHSEYTDPGFTATFFNKNIKNKVTINSNINTNKLGTYTITYKLPFPFNKKITRTIKIVDTTSPILTLIGKDTINIYLNESYIDKGVNIEDNYDTDLTKNLTIENNLDITKVGTYSITYTVHDSSNNISSITRTINVKNANTCDLSNPIDKYICKSNYTVSVGYYNLTNGNTYYFKPDKVYYGASLIKTVDALYLYEKNLINNDLKEHVRKIITYSDNASHHYLVNYIGKNKLKQYGVDLGAPNTLKGGDNYGNTTVKDQIVYMKKLYEITKDNQKKDLKSYFTSSTWNLLKFNGSPTIMHKYGHYESVHHNVGIVLDKNPYIVVILTKEGHGNFYNIVTTLSKLIYEYHKNNN